MMENIKLNNKLNVDFHRVNNKWSVKIRFNNIDKKNISNKLLKFEKDRNISIVKSTNDYKIKELKDKLEKEKDEFNKKIIKNQIERIYILKNNDIFKFAYGSNYSFMIHKSFSNYDMFNKWFNDNHKEYCINEVLYKHYTKIFFDIDYCKEKPITKEELNNNINELKYCIMKFSPYKNFNDIIILCKKDVNNCIRSYHVIFNDYITHITNLKQFVNFINENKLLSFTLDNSVYNTNKLFSCYTSFKIEQVNKDEYNFKQIETDKKKLIDCYRFNFINNEEKHKLKDTLINFYDNETEKQIIYFDYDNYYIHNKEEKKKRTNTKNEKNKTMKEKTIDNFNYEFSDYDTNKEDILLNNVLDLLDNLELFKDELFEASNSHYWKIINEIFINYFRNEEKADEKKIFNWLKFSSEKSSNRWSYEDNIKEYENLCKCKIYIKNEFLLLQHLYKFSNKNIFFRNSIEEININFIYDKVDKDLISKDELELLIYQSYYKLFFEVFNDKIKKLLNYSLLVNMCKSKICSNGKSKYTLREDELFNIDDLVKEYENNLENHQRNKRLLNEEDNIKFINNIKNFSYYIDDIKQYDFKMNEITEDEFKPYFNFNNVYNILKKCNEIEFEISYDELNKSSYKYKFIFDKRLLYDYNCNCIIYSFIKEEIEEYYKHKPYYTYDKSYNDMYEMINGDEIKNFLHNKFNIFCCCADWCNGKTSICLNKIVNNETIKNKRIVILTDTRTLNLKQLKDFKDFDYDIESNVEDTQNKNTKIYYNKNCVITMKSIHKISLSLEIELLVLDEFESLLMFFNARSLYKSNIEIKNAYNILIRIIEKSKKIIILDADLTDERINLIKRIKDIQLKNLNRIRKVKITRNHYENYKYKIYLNECDYENRFKQSLKKQEKIVCLSNSKKEIEKHYNIAKNKNYGYNQDEIENEICLLTGDGLKTLTNDTYKNKSTFIKDPNEELQKCNDASFFYNGCVKSGVSIDVKYFIRSFGYFSKYSVVVREIFQMKMRVRHLEEEECNIYIDDIDFKHTFKEITNEDIFKKVKQSKYKTKNKNFVNNINSNDNYETEFLNYYKKDINFETLKDELELLKKENEKRNTKTEEILSEAKKKEAETKTELLDEIIKEIEELKNIDDVNNSMEKITKKINDMKQVNNFYKESQLINMTEEYNSRNNFSQVYLSYLIKHNLDFEFIDEKETCKFNKLDTKEKKKNIEFKIKKLKQEKRDLTIDKILKENKEYIDLIEKQEEMIKTSGKTKKQLGDTNRKYKDISKAINKIKKEYKKNLEDRKEQIQNKIVEYEYNLENFEEPIKTEIIEKDEIGDLEIRLENINRDIEEYSNTTLLNNEEYEKKDKDDEDLKRFKKTKIMSNNVLNIFCYDILFLHYDCFYTDDILKIIDKCFIEELINNTINELKKLDIESIRYYKKAIKETKNKFDKIERKLQFYKNDIIISKYKRLTFVLDRYNILKEKTRKDGETEEEHNTFLKTFNIQQHHQLKFKDELQKIEEHEIYILSHLLTILYEDKLYDKYKILSLPIHEFKQMILKNLDFFNNEFKILYKKVHHKHKDISSKNINSNYNKIINTLKEHFYKIGFNVVLNTKENIIELTCDFQILETFNKNIYNEYLTILKSKDIKNIETFLKENKLLLKPTIYINNYDRCKKDDIKNIEALQNYEIFKHNIYKNFVEIIEKKQIINEINKNIKSNNIQKSIYISCIKETININDISCNLSKTKLQQIKKSITEEEQIEEEQIEELEKQKENKELEKNKFKNQFTFKKIN